MGKVIWTNHLQERIKQRGLSPSLVDKAVRFPDKVVPSSTDNSNKHIKVIGDYEIVAAVKRQGSDWIITSAWWKPVYQHSNGYGYKSKKDNRIFLEKWIYNFLVYLEKLITKK